MNLRFTSLTNQRLDNGVNYNAEGLGKMIPVGFGAANFGDSSQSLAEIKLGQINILNYLLDPFDFGENSPSFGVNVDQRSGRIRPKVV